MNTQNKDRWNDLVDGTLSEKEKQMLTDDERAVADEYVRFMRGLDDNISVPLDAQASWRKAVRAEAAKRRKSPKRTMIKTAAAVAAALIVLAGTTGVMRGTGMLSVPAAKDTAYRYINTDSANYAAEMPAEDFTMSLASDGVYEEAAEEAVFAASEDAAMLAEDAEPAAERAALPSAYATLDPEDEALMLARSAEYSASSADPDGDASLVLELIGENDGYAEKTEKQKNELRITARIPVDNLDTFLDSLESVGECVSFTRHSINIKENYYDAQRRLDALETEYDRLLALLDTANAASLASLREELENVTARMDSLRSDIAGWETDTAYSRVEITLFTGSTAPVPTPEPDLGQRISEGFSSSWKSVRSFLRDMLVALSVIAPAALVALPAAAVIVIVIIAIKKRKDKKHE